MAKELLSPVYDIGKATLHSGEPGDACKLSERIETLTWGIVIDSAFLDVHGPRSCAFCFGSCTGHHQCKCGKRHFPTWEDNDG